MKKIDVKNIRAKEKIAQFVGDNLLHEPKPRKLEKVYSLLAASDDFEVDASDQNDPQLKEYLEQLSSRAVNSNDFSIEVLDMLLFISRSRRDVVSEMIILAAVDILEQKVKSHQQDKKISAQLPSRPLITLSRDALPPPMPQIGLNNHLEDIVIKEQAVHFKEDDKAEDHFKYKHDEKRMKKIQQESNIQRSQLVTMKINHQLESKEAKFKPVFSSGDEAEKAQPKEDSSEEPNEPEEIAERREAPNPDKPADPPSDAAADKNANKSPSEESEDEGDDDDSEEAEEDASGESFDAEAFYEQFKHFEQTGLGDLNDSYLYDVRDPKDRSFQKEYLFERFEEVPQPQPPAGNLSQTQNPKPRKTSMVLKKRLSVQDKKKLDSLMSRIQRAKDGRELADLQIQIEQIIYVEAGAQQDFSLNKFFKKQGKDKNNKKTKITDKKKKREEKKKAKKLLKKTSQPPSATAKPNQPLPEFKKKDAPPQVKPIAKKPTQQKQKAIGTVFQNMKKWEGSDEEGSYPKFNQILQPSTNLNPSPPVDELTPPNQTSPVDAAVAPEPAAVETPELPPADPIASNADSQSTEQLQSQEPHPADPTDPTTQTAQPELSAQQPQPEPSPITAKDRFLSIQDLSKNFEYKYITGLDQDFRDAIEHLSAQKCIGFDTEFITVDSHPMATYLQFASREKGYIFNLQTEDRFKTEFKTLIEQVCKNSQLLKVGFNIKQDIPALTRVFNYDFECDGFVGLEERLFTAKSVTLGLSDLCLRKYGYPMNKELQKTLALKKHLDDEEEILYGVLDALAPLCLYLDLKKAIDSSPHDHLYLQEEFEPKDIEFMIDPSCKALKPLIQRSDFYNEVLDNLTYAEIKEKTHSKKAILITCDKAIISDPAFRNKFVFYEMKSFKQGSLL